MHVLTINAGSSSLKFKLFNLTSKLNRALLSGSVTNLQSIQCNFSVYNSAGVKIHTEDNDLDTNPYQRALELVLECNELKPFKLDAVIHRIVHGGDKYTGIIQLDAIAIKELTKFNDYAPLHQPYNLLVVEELLKKLPDVPNYACFDTAFHQTIPLINRIYAIPWQYTEAGIKKYGFHGLSYEYISNTLVEIVGHKKSKEPWIIAHLGGGSSLCAINDGKSVKTTMGFSCLDGIAMMTRCGELDAQIPLFLQQEYKLSPVEVLHLLNNESGLYGICKSKNMQEIMTQDTPQSKLAIELYCKSIATNIAKLVVELDSLAGIVFSAGIGENQSEIRERVCSLLEWLLGVKLDKDKNNTHQVMINSAQSKIKVLVIPTNEELVMATQFVAKYGVEQKHIGNF